MTPQEQRQLNDLLQEGIRLAKLLNDTAAEASFKNFTGDLKSAQLAVKGLREEARDFTSDISSAAVAFKNVVGEIRKTDMGLNQAGKSFNKLASIAEKVQYHQKEISKLSIKDVENLKAQSNQEAIKLKHALDLLETQYSTSKSRLDNVQREIASLEAIGDLNEEQWKRYIKLDSLQEKIQKNIQHNLDTQNEITGTLEGQNHSYNTLVSTLDRINRELEDERKLLGLGGAAVEGIGKALNKLGFGGLANQLGLDEAKKKMEETAEEIRKAGGNANSFSNKFKVLKSGISSMGSSLKTNLTDPLVVTGFLIDQIIDAFKIADSSAGDLAKSFDLSYTGANQLRMELTDIANLSGDVAVTTKGLQESMVAVGQSLGVNAMLNEADLKTFTKLREQAGYTNDELVGIQKLTLATGGNLEDNAKSFLGTVESLNAQNKLSINAKQLLKEVANVSDAIKLSVGGTTKALAEAAFKAKQFGINLEQADKISESLLDFESSINNQISAELITGKSLNLEKARLLALNGKIGDASAEILKQVGGTAEFTKMNRIQQEALAKAVGMSREDLAKSLVDREAAANLGAKEGQSAQDRYNELVKSYGVEKASAMLGNEALARQFQQQSTQERFAQAVEKLKEVFISLAEPILQIVSPFVDLATTIIPLVNLALLPITFTVKAIGEGIGYIVNSITGLIGLFTGANSQLTVMQGIVGAIAGTYLAIKGYALATKIIQGVSLGIEAARGGIAKENALLESKGLIKVIGQAIFNAISAFSQIPFGIGVPLGIAAGIGIASMASKYLSDGMIAPDGGLIVSGKKGTYQLDSKDTVVAGTDLGRKSPELPKYGDVIVDSKGNAEGASKGSFQLNTLNTLNTEASKIDKKEPNPSATSSPSIDLSPIIAAINNLSAKIESRPIIAQVELDGEKLTKGVMKRTTTGGIEQQKNVVKVQ